MIAFEQTQQDVVEVKNDLKELKAYLLRMAESQNQADDPKPIEEIEKLTGYTRNTLYGYCRENKIPHHKKNGRLFFFKSEIIDWIKEGKRKTIQEVEADADLIFSKKKNFNRKNSRGVDSKLKINRKSNVKLTNNG